MTFYEKSLAKLAPEMNPTHMETLARAVGPSTLNGMPSEFFYKIAALARDMGPERLAEFHYAEVA